MTEEAAKPETAPKDSALKTLTGPHATLVAIVMAFFGAGGMFSFDRLSNQITVQTEKMAEMSTTLTKIEAREASFQESISVAKVLADRHEERIRGLENASIQREGRILALEKVLEEMRRQAPR